MAQLCRAFALTLAVALLLVAAQPSEAASAAVISADADAAILDEATASGRSVSSFIGVTGAAAASATAEQASADEGRGGRLQVGVFIAWIAYGGQCSVDHALAVASLLLMLQRQDLSAQVNPIVSESLIPRARNIAAALFLESSLTHMLFVDADIVFDPLDVLAMLRLDRDVIGGAYRLKSDTFGFSFDGQYYATETPGVYKTLYLSTGFTLISRRALAKVAETHPDRTFRNHIPSYRVTNIYDFFPIGIDKNRIYLSEDYGFSQLCTESGVEMFLYGNATLKHIGKSSYVGNLHQATLSVAAAQTAGKDKQEATQGLDLSAEQVWRGALSLNQLLEEQEQFRQEEHPEL